jgi:hypothetical protein
MREEKPSVVLGSPGIIGVAGDPFARGALRALGLKLNLVGSQCAMSASPVVKDPQGVNAAMYLT